MYIKPIKIGSDALDAYSLKIDKKECRKFGPCGVGYKAIYLSGFYLERKYYIVPSSIKRIFKRISMSSSGEGRRGMFASLTYLVVILNNDKEKKFLFKNEEDVDAMLCCIKERFPGVVTVSAAAEERMAKKKQEEEQIVYPKLSDDEEKQIELLEKAASFLDNCPVLIQEMSSKAKKLRAYEQTKPGYRILAISLMILGLASTLYGIYCIFSMKSQPILYIFLGVAIMFVFSGANVLPTAKNNKKTITKKYMKAVTDVEAYIGGWEHSDYGKYGEFPLPPFYAHPLIIRRMIESIKRGQAKTVDEALEFVKDDLKKLNKDVSVERSEFMEIIEIKPLFLVRDYK